MLKHRIILISHLTLIMENTLRYASFFINDVDNYIALIDEDEDHEESIMKMKMSIMTMKTTWRRAGDGHGNLIHANYVQEDAEFDGYEIEFGRTMS